MKEVSEIKVFEVDDVYKYQTTDNKNKKVYIKTRLEYFFYHCIHL